MLAAEWAIRDIGLAFTRGYCRVADRIFRGDRCRRHVERCAMLAEMYQAEAEMLRSEQLFIDTLRLKERMQVEVSNNPGYVAPPNDTVQ